MASLGRRVMEEFIDRSEIERNANGSEEPHSAEPELWDFEGTELDLSQGHAGYKFGKQLWYLRGRAMEMLAGGKHINARPMNARARASGIKGLPPRRPGEAEQTDDSDEKAAGAVSGLDGLFETPPQTVAKGPSGRTYGSTSTLFRLHVADQPRKAAILFVEWPPFDMFILVTILVNCATMAWNSPLDPCCDRKAEFIAAAEWVYLAIFSIEMAAKIVACIKSTHRLKPLSCSTARASASASA